MSNTTSQQDVRPGTRRLEPDSGLVVLVHGLWMGAPACALLARRLRARGHAVVSFPYRSVRHSLEASAARLHAFVTQRAAGKVDFVGHSLGGLVILSALARHPQLPVRRVVLLGSPCNGSEAVQQLLPSTHGRWLLGRALPGWQPAWGPEVAARCEVGAIAGNRRLGLAALAVNLRGENDGAVRVDETRIAGLRDHLVLPVTHSGMLVSGRVAAQVDAFLSSGRFRPVPDL
jgi:pimeloyl-ACP methyl ester carboxylesterase